MVVVIGAGLAGSEAAWQLAERGVSVRLYEMKPERFSPAHKREGFAELVCSNSLRSNDIENAAGLLKREMEELGSLVIEAALAARLPAGKALAVDRQVFSDYVTSKIRSHPLIEVICEEVTSLEGHSSPIIIATGPLTAEALSREIAEIAGSDHLYFYDSVSPIVDSTSLDFNRGYWASRYGYGDGDDYLNFPLSRGEYLHFVSEVAQGEKMAMHVFEEPKYFEGCLPIEVMAERGPETLRYGPMKPFGLPDRRLGREPYAVVQLRQEDKERTMLSLVGFQTRLTWPEQKRIFQKIPGFEAAEFLRYGVIHRNTYINSPKVLTPCLEVKTRRSLFFAGQITGVEGYIESAAMGLWTGLYLGSLLTGKALEPPPTTTAIGSLVWHVANPHHRNFQPMNVNFGLMPIIKEEIPKKMRKGAMVARARADFEIWQRRGRFENVSS